MGNRDSIDRFRQWAGTIRVLARMPRVTVDLRFCDTAANDPFFARIVREYYDYTRSRARRFPFLRRDSFGVALCPLPATFDEYFARVESAGRRNVRKAERNGYRFERICFNDHLDDIRDIWRSAPVRQGPVPAFIRNGEVKPSTNPESVHPAHDYPYFGVLRGPKLAAYAGCLIAGEACMIEQVYGHAAFQEDGVTPLLIVGLVRHVLDRFALVRYVTYDNWFGASITLRRFKRKFGFAPHRVTWRLG